MNSRQDSYNALNANTLYRGVIVSTDTQNCTGWSLEYGDVALIITSQNLTAVVMTVSMRSKAIAL